jgi:hypothetical protein
MHVCTNQIYQAQFFHKTYWQTHDKHAPSLVYFFWLKSKGVFDMAPTPIFMLELEFIRSNKAS